jgi:hypothetical protein
MRNGQKAGGCALTSPIVLLMVAAGLIVGTWVGAIFGCR